MKDNEIKFTVNEKEYKAIFNLNVMQQIQEEYGSIAKWGDLTEKGEEPNVKALIFGIGAMINESIEIENDKTGGNEKLLTNKQIGRLISEMGILNAATQLNNAVVEGTKSDIPKNE